MICQMARIYAYGYDGGEDDDHDDDDDDVVLLSRWVTIRYTTLMHYYSIYIYQIK